MKIQISEVWNSEGRSEVLATIETPDNHIGATIDVYRWIEKNRPDLILATTIDAHGFHAKAVRS